MKKSAHIYIAGEPGYVHVNDDYFKYNPKRHKVGKDMIVPEDKITKKLLNVFKIKAFKDELSVYNLQIIY